MCNNYGGILNNTLTPFKGMWLDSSRAPVYSFTLSNAREFYSLKRRVLPLNGLNNVLKYAPYFIILSDSFAPGLPMYLGNPSEKFCNNILQGDMQFSN